MPPERRRGRASSRLARILRILVGILLAHVFLQCGIARSAASTPPSATVRIYNSDSFITELRRLETELEPEGTTTEGLRKYGKSLPAAWSVEAGGRYYDVPTDLLVSRVAKAEREPNLRVQQLDQARAYLDALADETASLSGQPSQNAESAKSKLDAILARPEFSHSLQVTWWDRFRARVNDLIVNALTRIFRRIGGQKSFGQALLWFGVCAGAILIAYWIFRGWFRVARMQEMALEAAAVPSRSWQEWVRAGCDAAGRGDYRIAVHCAYWAGITRLQELGTLSADRSKTPREYLHALTKSKLVMPETLATRQLALSMLTARLEKIWYGYQIATETDFRESLAQLEALGCHLP